MPGRRRVAFARINQRSTDQQPLERRPFAEDMKALADSRETSTTFRNSEWIAADLRLDPSENFMVGILGFAQTERLRDFDPQTFSWLKGEVHEQIGASERTMVPFAIDLRDDERWVAFAVAQRIQPPGFATGFSAILNAAFAKVSQLPSEWEVDLLSERARIEEWIEEHPDVVIFTRLVRLHNPVDHIDEDREAMRALAARTKEEKFTAARNGHLRVRDNPDFDRMLDGLDTGDLEVKLEARHGATRVRFSSRRAAETTLIDDYGDDLERGMDLVLQAVQEYASRRRGDGQATMVDN